MSTARIGDHDVGSKYVAMIGPSVLGVGALDHGRGCDEVGNCAYPRNDAPRAGGDPHPYTRIDHADITPGAVAELDLAPGRSVYFAVKATEVQVYPC
ncbi:TOBE domain-containing protein [Nocardia sp. NPDC050630]|uniref:TOBE domain-containing protein n=1 Tax=Nocardia sp. NPDC050630 TaxID=3364321 RepID=UPI0037A5FB53